MAVIETGSVKSAHPITVQVVLSWEPSDGVELHAAQLGLPGFPLQAVLAEIPPVRTPFEKRRDRWVTLTIFVFAGVAVAVYVGIATAALMWVI